MVLLTPPAKAAKPASLSCKHSSKSSKFRPSSCKVVLRPPAKAAKPASMSCELQLETRINCCRVLLETPAKAAKTASLSSEQSQRNQAQLLQGAAEPAG